MSIKDVFRKCVHCGMDFTNEHKESMYCSRSCYFKSRIGKLRKSVKKNCENCKKPFYLSPFYAQKRKYCSVACKRDGMRNDKGGNWKGGCVQAECQYCHNQFSVKKSEVRHNRGRFCSKKCFDLSRVKRTSVPCPTCGNIRELRDSDVKRGRVFCNQKCYRLHHPTSIESKIRNYLSEKGVYFIPEYNIGRWSIDIFVPSVNLAIECDGEYWHRNTQQRDARKDNVLAARGITVLRLSEKDIRNNMKYCEMVISSHLQ